MKCFFDVVALLRDYSKMISIWFILFIFFPLVLNANTVTSSKVVDVGSEFKIVYTISGTQKYFNLTVRDESVVDAYLQTVGSHVYLYVTGKKIGSTTVIVSKWNDTNSRWDYNNYNVTVVDVTNILIPSSLSLTLGNNYTFSPDITDNRATTTLTWSSSNPSIVSISNATIKAESIGTAIIRCVASNGVFAQCVVTVTPIMVTNVSLNCSSLELIEDETFQLIATVSPFNATNKNIKWESSDPNVAIVDSFGKITAISGGNCVIQAVPEDGSGNIATCSIKVLSDYVYTDNVVGVPTGNILLPIMLKNTSSITGIQFKLKLPNGISVAEDIQGNYMTSLTDRAYDQRLMCSKLSDGTYQIVAFSTSSSAFYEHRGVCAYIKLSISNNISVGYYELKIQDVELTNTNGEAIHHKDVASTLSITAVNKGDTNNDGHISITDAVNIVNYILGNPPTNFVLEAADVNDDGKITITDAVGIVNIILQGNGKAVNAKVI